MYFSTKNYLKNTQNHTPKHTLNIFEERSNIYRGPGSIGIIRNLGGEHGGVAKPSV